MKKSSNVFPQRRHWLDALRGEPGTRQIEPYLDGVRAIAVLMIFVRHAWGLSASPRLGFKLPVLGEHSLASTVNMFASGVDLFFVLSGFLLARSFIKADFLGRPRPFLKNYYLQRLTRIGPPYWVALVAVLFIFVPSLIREEAVYSKAGAVNFLAHALFAQAAYLPAFGSYRIESPFWTLTVEALFYGILPFLVPLFYRSRWRVFLPLSFAVSLGWLYACRYSMDSLVAFVGKHGLYTEFDVASVRFFLSRFFFAHLFHFACGMTVCNRVVSQDISLHKSAERPKGSRWGIVLMLLATIWTLSWMVILGRLCVKNNWTNPNLFILNPDPGALLFHFSQGLTFAAGYAVFVYGCALAPNQIKSWFSKPALCYIGVIGYSIYLLHMPILYHINELMWLRGLSPPTHFAALCLCAGAVTLILSTAFFVGIERPAMCRAKRFGSATVQTPETSLRKAS